MIGAVKKMSGWCFIPADFEAISIILLPFIVFGQQKSCFDGFCGLWTIKMDVSKENQFKNIYD